MFTTVGPNFIAMCILVIEWLLSNFLGSAYMFMVLMVFFAVIFTLGGKNQ